MVQIGKGGLAATIVCMHLALGGGALAQNITLRAADTFPVANNHLTDGFIPWMEEVTRLTGGKVKFQHFPAGQLGSSTDMLMLTQTGAVDIGYIAPSYLSDKLPLGEVGTMPGLFSSSCQGTAAFRKVVAAPGPLRKEFEDNGVHVILAVTNPPYSVFTTDKKASPIAGLRLRSGGGLQDMLVTQMKAVPIRMAAPETHESLSRGTLDGVIFPANSLSAYGIEEMVKNGTGAGAGFGSFLVTYGVNMAVWEKLPDAYKAAMEQAADTVTQRWCTAIQKGNDDVIARLKAKGVDIHDFTAEEQQQLHAAAIAVADAWVRDLEKRGKPARQVFDAFSAALGQ